MRNGVKQIALVAVAALAFVMTTAAVLELTMRTPEPDPAVEDDTKPDQQIQDIQEDIQEEPDWMYFVSEYDGCIAVYDAKQPQTPKYVSKMRTELLPEADRIRLQEGIKLYSEEELTALLEDFDA